MLKLVFISCPQIFQININVKLSHLKECTCTVVHLTNQRKSCQTLDQIYLDNLKSHSFIILVSEFKAKLKRQKQ